MSCQEAQELAPRARRPFLALWRKVFHLLPPSPIHLLSPVCTGAVYKTWVGQKNHVEEVKNQMSPRGLVHWVVTAEDHTE